MDAHCNSWRRPDMVAAMPTDTASFFEALSCKGPSPLDRRFGQRDFARLQQLISSNASLAHLAADILDAEIHAGHMSHLCNNLAYWLGRSQHNGIPCASVILRSYRLVEDRSVRNRAEFMRSHLISLGNLFGDSFIRRYLLQLDCREHRDTNLGYYHDYYGSILLSFHAMQNRLESFSYPNCLLDLHTLYYSMDVYGALVTDRTRDILSSARRTFEWRDRLVVDKCLAKRRPAIVNEKQHLRSEYMYDVFISHASEDKAAVARPLALALSKRGFAVWYDEFSLSAGDSLRAKIDAGLVGSRFGIAILSPAFFAKGWPMAELDGIFALHLRGRSRMIPVLHGLTHDELLEQSPMIGGLLCIQASGHGIRGLVRQISDRICV